MEVDTGAEDTEDTEDTPQPLQEGSTESQVRTARTRRNPDAGNLQSFGRKRLCLFRF